MANDEFQNQTLSGSALVYPGHLVQKLLAILERRFMDVETAILGATKIAYLPSWPSEFQSGGPYFH